MFSVETLGEKKQITSRVYQEGLEDREEVPFKREREAPFSRFAHLEKITFICLALLFV